MDGKALLTHARCCHEDPGDNYLRDGLFGCVCRLAQAVPVFICDRNANFEFPRRQDNGQRSSQVPSRNGWTQY